MKWEKLGLVWGPDGSMQWARNSALQPTAMLLDDDVIRVYVGLRDDSGVGRVGFVDVAADDPTRVIGISKAPALDIGRPGTFDENGVVPTALVRRSDEVYLYYAGYQLGQKVRFLAFGGVAVSNDGGATFTRVHEVPVTDRTDDELYFRVIHSIFEERGVWRAWYGAGSTFVPYEGKTLPVYDIRYMESPDGFTFPGRGRVVVPLGSSDENRVGRPYVLRRGDRYLMFFGAATKKENYRLTCADSRDGIEWTRRDDQIGIEPTPGSWDSDMQAYPCVIEAGGRFYLFYNGNEYGKAGFGCAVLREW